MFGFLFGKNKRINEFATRMADELFSAVPQDVTKQYLGGKTDKKKTKAVESRIGDMTIQFQQFKLKEKLGVYGKARLHLSFMNRLETLGYDQEIAKRINEKILLKSM
jgi:hypothetical protein